MPRDTAQVASDFVLAEAAPAPLLLRAAIAEHLQRSAGSRQSTSNPASASFPADSDAASLAAQRASASGTAVWRLVKMLGGDRRELVREWFALAESAQLVIDTHWLPAVLAALDGEARAKYSSVLGPFASWLARANDDWRDVAAPAADLDEATWATSTVAQRCEVLRKLRTRDRDRERGMRLLQSTWAEDAPDVREQFMAAIAEASAPDDEAFLELALDDKRKAVRVAAADLLARLPNSALVQRHIVRAQTLIDMPISGRKLLGTGRKRSLTLTLPEAPDKAAQRDGVEPKPPAARKIGERAFWLVQIVSRIPPAHWCERFACSPEEFLQACAATDYDAELMEALTDAASRFPEPAWLTALLERAMSNSKKVPDELRFQAALKLIATALPSQQIELIRRALRGADATNFYSWSPLFAVAREAWSSELSELAIENLRTTIRKDKQAYAYPRNALTEWASHIDLDAAGPRARELLEALPTESAWRNAIEELADTIEFRIAMRRELQA
jgi:hypothetical protein